MFLTRSRAVSILKSLPIKEREHLKKVSSSQKLSNLVSDNCREDSEMRRSLCLAIDCICSRIALRKLSKGE